MCTDESFKRPRFFAGQLLTEDDLQAMMDYVVGKNRLHNRYLFGEGVVCGLAVTCHPCGGGSVMVAPGFALDCCGNDLVLPCAEEVDIGALLRDLRKRQLQGYECGDPCEDKGDHRQYGLYLTYNETPADPVAPYNGGDSCGQQGCEPTRICEGYGFELRCECTVERQADLYARILACIGDIRSANSAIARAQNLYEVATTPRYANKDNPPLEEPRRNAALLKSWLVTRLEQAGSRTRCDLYDRVKAISLTPSEPDFAGRDQLQDSEAQAWLNLIRVLLEYFIDCACLALNPSCGACDDTALLLACVELDGCNVVDICNLSRRFVLSPAAMRYWLPANLVGDLLKRFCCDLDLSRLIRLEPREERDFDAVVNAPAEETSASDGFSIGIDNVVTRSAARRPPADASAVQPPAGSPAAPPRAGAPAAAPARASDARILLERIGIRPETAVEAGRFSKGLADLALRVGRVDTGDLRRRSSAVTGELVSRLQPDAASVIEAPAVRDRMTAMVKEEVAATRASALVELRQEIGTSTEAAVGTLRKNVTAEVGTLSQNLSKVPAEVEKQVGAAVRRELAATRLNGAVENLAVMKALRKENEKLRADLGKLSEAVAKLGGRA
jgi:hypothetical protein